jgi:Xaa-Pro aminopeptidase
MNRSIAERLKRLRFAMQAEKIDACIIPDTDPHQSEYIAPYLQFREWLSGFTGSAGKLVIGHDQAGLWTDSRYFLQAEQELERSGILLFKSGLPDTPSPEEWMVSQKYTCIGIDGNLFSTQTVEELLSYFQRHAIRLSTRFEPYGEVWDDRPAAPSAPFFVQTDDLAGESVASKLTRIRAYLREHDVDLLPLSALDEIAWVYNLRGSDIEYNPVGMAFACIGLEEAHLFTEPGKITTEVQAHLATHRIQEHPYNDLPHFLKQQPEARVLFDDRVLSYRLHEGIANPGLLVRGHSPIGAFKAVKNSVERAGFRRAMYHDGIALVRFHRWLEQQRSEQAALDEYRIGEALRSERAKEEGYTEESFAPIVAFRSNGAIVHYEPKADTAQEVTTDGVLLMDTGGQYRFGTTDITRTLYLGRDVPEAFKRDYTALLKGLIALSSIVFPSGTRGAQLDVLARQFLWKQGANYLHGTGHGVGHFLNVHEGPQSIRMNENPAPLKPGMTVTNEPGIYRTGLWGCRLENVLLVKEHTSTDFGDYLCFETLTLFPFESACLLPSELTREETEWLNRYHAQLYEKLAPGLDSDDREWLQRKTQPLLYT